MHEYFPWFAALVRSLRRMMRWYPWKSTTVWPSDTLSSKQRTLLRVLSVAASDRLEAAPLVAAMAQEHRGYYRRRLRRLAKRLSAGMPLSDALEQTPNALSDEDTLAVRFGEQSGTLPTLLATLVADQDRVAAAVVSQLRQLVFYVILFSAIFVFVLTFILMRIMPDLQAIFNDFELDLPESTQNLIFISDLWARYWYVSALLVLLLASPIVVQPLRRFFRRKISSRILRPVAQLRSANLLNLLAVNSSAGRPMAGAISTLARYHFDDRIRQKLLFVRNEIEQGANVWQSMATTRLISPQEALALQKSTSSDTRSWTMNRLVDLKRSAVERRLDLMITLVQPVVILLLAATVLGVAIACLSPLFDLTNGLSG